MMRASDLLSLFVCAICAMSHNSLTEQDPYNNIIRYYLLTYCLRYTVLLLVLPFKLAKRT
jgi:hypothetical protein